MGIFNKTCPISGNKCNPECAWCRLIGPNTYDCLIALIAKGQKPLRLVCKLFINRTYPSPE